MIFTDIEKEALSLTVEEQTQLVNSLVANIESTTDAEISHSWALESLQRLKELGIRWYNLGGINPDKNPGVYHFKEGLSGEDVLYMPPLAASKNTLSSMCVRSALFLRQSRLLRRLRAVINDPKP